ncbi:uncharacterized protein LOC108664631 [Hyalella azteca]|uniref:Uncharacterized protein LOC108664631 n=1 Tax=Hyalella azteca TaxID=294128 RepID=A0A8B7N0K1_HYAAZ|nr:uncharacterized protein LOC108664631 [Hyalella azteca]
MDGASQTRVLKLSLIITAAVMTVIAMMNLIIDDAGHHYSVVLDEHMQSTRPYPASNGSLTAAGQFYDELRSYSAVCRRRVRLGGNSCRTHGIPQLELCMEQAVMPPHTLCVVYSFGQDVNLTFEESVWAARNCSIHMFDPTSQASSPIPIYLEGGDFHHPVGLMNMSADFKPRHGHSNVDWEVVGLILEAYKSLHPLVHVLKLDLHGAEWEALERLSALGLLERVQQLTVTLHTWHLKTLPYDHWFALLQRYRATLSAVSAAGLRQVAYTESAGQLTSIQMPTEDRPRRTCLVALFTRHANESSQHRPQ